MAEAKNDPRGFTSLLGPIFNPDPAFGPGPVVVKPGFTVPDVFATIPPNTPFIFEDPITGEQSQRERVFDDLPLINVDILEDREVFDRLPPGGFFRTPDGQVQFKEISEPSLAQRGLERFLGMDIDPKSLGVEIPRIVSTMTGGAAGGRVGTMLPIPTTNPLGITIKGGGTLVLGGLGAAMGAIMPEQTMLYAERFGLAPEGFRDKYGYTDEELRTLFLGEGILDMAFGGTLSGLRAVARPAARFITGLGEEGQNLAEIARQRGINMMPVQLGDGSVARQYVAVMGRFPFFGDPFKRVGQEAAESFTRVMKGLPSRFGPLLGSNDLSVRIFDEARSLVKDVDEVFGEKYQDIYRRANELGVKVIPTNALEEAKLARETIQKSRTVGPDGALNPLSAAQQKVDDFLRTEILQLEQQAIPTGPVQFGRNPQTGLRETTRAAEFPALESGEQLRSVPQTLDAIDGLLTRLDTTFDEIKSNSNGRLPEGLQLIRSNLNSKIKADIASNVVEPAGRDSRGALMFKRSPEGTTGNIGAELQELDAQFSTAVNALFETVAANMFKTVRSGGLRATVKPSQEATRANIDTLAKTLLTVVPKSPNTVRELRRLIGGDSFAAFANSYIDNAIRRATNKQGILDISKLRDTLGVGDPNSPQAQSLGYIFDTLRNAGDVENVSKVLSLPEIEDLLRVGEKIADLDLPDVSTFLARKATIGGLRGARSAFMPFAAGAAAGAGGATFFGLPSLVGIVMGIAGARGFSALLANPLSALPFSKVVDAELAGIQDKTNFVRAGSAAIRTALRLGGAGIDVIDEKVDAFNRAVELLEGFEEDPSSIPEPSQEILDLEDVTVEDDPSAQAFVAPPPFAPMTQTVPAPAMMAPRLNIQEMIASQPVAQGAPSPQIRAQYAGLFPQDFASGVINAGIGSLPVG